MASAPLPLEASPISFGTDGWRGILGVDITVERLLPVAAAAARELASSAPPELASREVVIGYDRRFLAPELAEAMAAAVRGADLVPAAGRQPRAHAGLQLGGGGDGSALGALVITASHNPPEWLGLKIKGPFGGSVEGDFTARVEKRLSGGRHHRADPGRHGTVRCHGHLSGGPGHQGGWHALAEGLDRLALQVIVDPMHGSAAGGLPALLGRRPAPPRA